MNFKFLNLVIFVLTLVCLISNAFADIGAAVSVSDVAPRILSVTTYFQYTNYLTNTPSDSFNHSNVTVYIQVRVKDSNGAAQITGSGYVGVKIVLLNGSTESLFPRFGSSFMNATLEAASGSEAIYTYSFNMLGSDEERKGTETPPKYYRVKAQVSDGTQVVESASSSEYGDYTFTDEVPQEPQPPNPPPTVLFDVAIEVPENKKTVEPGDSFYASVTFKKVSPPGLDDVTLTYTILAPDNSTVDEFMEVIAMNDTLYRVPVLYLPDDAEPGRYIFKASVLYLGVYTWSQAYFEVIEPATTTSTSTTLSTTTTSYSTTTTSSVTTTTRRKSSGGGGSRETVTTRARVSGPTTTLAEPKPKVAIQECPSEVITFEGESKPVMVVVENTGGTVLRNVTVQVDGSLSNAKIVPESVEILEPGEKKVFIIEVDVPEGMSSGGYPSTFNVRADEAGDSRNINFQVLERPQELKKELSIRVDDLEKLTDEIWSQIAKLDLTDSEVSEVYKLLNDSRIEINNARLHLDNREFDESTDALTKARENIEESVIKLSKLKSKEKIVKEYEKVSIPFVPQEIIDAYYTQRLAFILVLILCLVTLTFLVIETKRKLKTDKALEKAYDLRRMKDLVFRSRGNSGSKTQKDSQQSGSLRDMNERTGPPKR